LGLISSPNKKQINQLALAFLAVMIGLMFIFFTKLPEPFIWAYQIFVLIVFYLNFKNYNLSGMMDRQGYVLTSIFIGWLFCGFLRGAFVADDYWTWKFVVGNFLVACFFIVIFLSTNIYVVQRYYSLYFIFFIPLVAFSYLMDGTPLNLNYVPYSTLMIFIGVIPKRQRLFLIAIMIFFFLTNFQRNDLVKILVTGLIGITFTFYSKLFIKFILKPIYIFLFCLPLLLVGLGTSGIFNVFKMDEYIKGDYEQEVSSNQGKEKEDLKADTRTFIYQNVFFTLNKYDAWLFGRGSAFGDEGIEGFFEKENKVKVKGRYGNEVGIMDILLWYGLIGVVIYFLVYLRASFVAIYQSKNRYAKAVGLYVAFLWTWSFIWEKPMFETFFMMDLILLGLCFSNRFRGMNDREFHLWVEGIFKNNPKRILA
jgi:hypothetical protein